MENRRVRLTRRMIKDALVELTQSKTVDKITVKDVCELADVNRSTFYDHYTDIYALLDDVERDFISRIPLNYSSDTTAATDLLSFVRYIESNRELYVSMRKYGAALEDRLTRTVWESYRQSLNGLDGAAIKIEEMDVKYVIAGSCRVLDGWLAGDVGGSAEEIANLLMRLALGVFGARQA